MLMRTLTLWRTEGYERKKDGDRYFQFFVDYALTFHTYYESYFIFQHHSRMKSKTHKHARKHSKTHITKKTRKGPIRHASETAIGTVEYVPNRQGQPWIVIPAGKSKRWTKATGYFTHDNGSRPFYVTIQNKEIKVMKLQRKDNDLVYDKHILTIPRYEKLYIGENTGKYANKREVTGRGNSFLVHIRGNQYIYIGDHVFQFTTVDPIKEFHGIVGPNDVVYAFAIGTENTYFFNGNKYLPNSMFGSQDPYATYFEYEKSAKSIKGKIIEKRDPYL